MNAQRLFEDPVATKAVFDTVLDTPGGRRMLARFSRTCKNFLEPGLGVLWRELDSLVPLISLFPSQLFRRARRPGLGFAEPPSAADWIPILTYGSRVRRLTYDEGTKAVSPSIFPILEVHRPRPYILPNLTSLVWRVETPAGLGRIHLFLSPDLQHLTLELGSKFPQLDQFFADLASRTRLQSLSISSPTDLPDDLPKLLEPQDSLEHLALIAPGVLSSSVGSWTASLPYLHSLQLDLGGRNPTEIEAFFKDILMSPTVSSSSSGRSSPSTDSGVFSEVEEPDFADLKRSALLLADEHEARTPRIGAFGRLHLLQLSGDVGSIVTFLKRVASPLQQLELAIEDPFVSTDWQDLLHLVCQYFGDTLTSLKITGSGASRFADLVRAGRPTTLDPPVRRLPLDGLTYLPRLLRFELDLPESYGLRDNDLACIGQACPSLETLRLCATARFPISGGPPGIGFDGLAALTARCVHLHTVAFPLDGNRAPDDAIFFNLAASSRSLRRLHVGHGWARDPLRVAVVISHLAPHLDALRWFHEKNRPGYIDAHAQAWARGAEMLPLLQGVRLTERWVAMSYMPEPRETVDRGVGTEPIQTKNASVSAVPRTADGEVQWTPAMAESAVQAEPEMCSVEIDAIPIVVEKEIDATPQQVEESVDATPQHVEESIDATPFLWDQGISATPSTSSIGVYVTPESLLAKDKHVHFEPDETNVTAHQSEFIKSTLSSAFTTPRHLYVPQVVSSTVNLAWKAMLFGPNFVTARMHDIWRLSPFTYRSQRPHDVQQSVANGTATEMEVMDIDSEKGSQPTSPLEHDENGFSPVCI